MLSDLSGIYGSFGYVSFTTSSRSEVLSATWYLCFGTAHPWVLLGLVERVQEDISPSILERSWDSFLDEWHLLVCATLQRDFMSAECSLYVVLDIASILVRKRLFLAESVLYVHDRRNI